MKTKYILSLGLFSSSLIAQAQQNDTKLTGTVLNDKKEPIEFATVYCVETGRGAVTDSKGNYTLALPKNTKNATIKVSFIGHKESIQKLAVAADNLHQNFVLQSLGLSLQEVVVIPETKSSDNSNSAISFDRQAIEQVQAFSLVDVLNTLPGKETINPNLNQIQPITLRGGLGKEYDMANSLGVAVIMDGVNLSNDANMQTRNVSQWGINNAGLSTSSKMGVTDVAMQGNDLRDIPVENIESIEVIQGVASAKYGELTDGAIIIERQAGKTPYQFSLNVNGGSTSASLSKGIGLGPKLGALNVTLNYLNSNADPRDKVNSYNRYAPSLMWTKNFTNRIKNTLSVDAKLRNDQARQDEDDATKQRGYSKTNQLQISNRLKGNFESKFVRQLTFVNSLNIGKQETYKQYYINLLPIGYTNKDTTGIYEGYYIPRNYLAKQHIIGEPITFASKLDLTTFFTAGNTKHTINYGASYSYENNGGKGILADPDRPRNGAVNGQNERPYSFEYIPGLHNVGLYVEDNMRVRVGGKMLNTIVGLRQDWQNGYATLQPRVNVRYNLSKNWQLNLAGGTATKAPTLAHRYPANVFLDIPLLDVYTGVADQSMYLVFTDKIVPDNTKLKPSKSTQYEAGLRFNNGFINASIFGYYKQNRDGFTTQQELQQYNLPKYGYNYTLEDGITYYQTGDSTTYTSYGYNKVINGLNSDVFGTELILQTKKVKAIQTSFNMSTNISWGTYTNKARVLESIGQTSQPTGEEVAWYAVYENKQYNIFNATSKFGTATHIPQLGFIVSLNADVIWAKQRTNDAYSGIPVAYINNKYEYVPIKDFDPSNPLYAGMSVNQDDAVRETNAIIYGRINMTLAKEINKSIRLSITAYNLLNMKSQTYKVSSSGTEVTTKYNEPVAITAGLTVKF